MAGAVANTMANTRQTVRTAGELADLAGAISALIGRGGGEAAGPRGKRGGSPRARPMQTLPHNDDSEAAGG
jgi:hypothetical protein